MYNARRKNNGIIHKKVRRNTFVDCLKVYACILVVFGHVILGLRNAGIVVPEFSHFLEKFIWSFHMALFMFLSGYVYQITGEWKGKQSRIKFICHKLLNLGVPYFVFYYLYYFFFGLYYLYL